MTRNERGERKCKVESRVTLQKSANAHTAKGINRTPYTPVRIFPSTRPGTQPERDVFGEGTHWLLFSLYTKLAFLPRQQQQTGGMLSNETG